MNVVYIYGLVIGIIGFLCLAGVVLIPTPVVIGALSGFIIGSLLGTPTP